MSHFRNINIFVNGDFYRSKWFLLLKRSWCLVTSSFNPHHFLGTLAVGIIFYLLRRPIMEEKEKVIIAFVLAQIQPCWWNSGGPFLASSCMARSPSPWDALFSWQGSAELVLWQWKEEFGRSHLPIVAFSGWFLHRWTLAQGVQNLGMTFFCPQWSSSS